MLDLFVDTNIVLDHVGRREPFYQLSRKVLLLGVVGEARTFINTNMLADMIYLLRKDYGSAGAQRLVRENLSFLQVVGVSPDDASMALKAEWSDFEDCLVARCAEKVQADFIVTRNVKDFSRSMVPAISPADLFAELERRGITYEEVGL